MAAVACAGTQDSASSIGLPLSESALRARLFAFANDSMRGRRAGTPDNDRATDYIAAQFRAIGLEPAGENGTFFQNVPLREQMIPDSTVNISIGGRGLRQMVDYLPRDNGQEAHKLDGAQAIFGGFLGDTATLLAGGAAVGKVVVLALKPGQFAAVKSELEKRFAQSAAIAVANFDLLPYGVRQTFASPSVTRPAPGLPAYFHISVALLTEIFGATPAELKVGASGATLHGGIKFDLTTIQSRNVVAILRGSDAALRHQFVAIGSHNDHEGTGPPVDADSLRAFNLEVRRLHVAGGNEPSAAARNAIRVDMDSIRRLHPKPRLDSVFNGADDDGSGTVAMIEIARALAASPNKPRRSILFVSHTAEEDGLVGSAYFTDHATVARDSIVAHINLDMIGRGSAGEESGGGPDYLQVVGARRLSTQLGDLVESVSTEKQYGWKFDYTVDAPGHRDQLYCRSDHFSYARFGIPVVFISTGNHADYHEVTDEPERLNYAKLAKVSSFVRDLLERLANLDHRIAVDKPKPDPLALCVQ